MARNFHNKSKDLVEKSKHTLELDEDVKAHLVGWRIQRIGWLFFALVFVTAALGLFGTGVLSNRSANSNGFKLEYEHYGRFESPTKSTISFPANQLTTLSVPLSYISQMKIDKLIPEPQEQKMENGNLILTFNAVNNGELIVYLVPQTTGAVNGTIYINNVPFEISHFIYP